MDTPLPALRVLLIEDNPGDARLVQAALAEQAPGEFTVAVAERLADALARLQSERFDAVLCDLGLPDSTGLGTAQAVAAHVPGLPLVVLTGSHEVELGRAAIKLGAQDYLIKGDLKPPLLSGTLRYAIERTRLAHELREANASLEQRVAERTAELEAAARSLVASETRYRNLFETSVDAIVFGDAAGHVHAANPAACRIFGLTEEEIRRAGRNGLIDTSNPRLPEFLQKRSSSVGASGELTFLRKDGTKFPGDISGSEFTDSDGSAASYMIIRDITARKQAEAALLKKSDALRQQNAELERFNKVSVGREMDLIDLKRRVNALSRELGRAEPFNLAFADAPPAPGKEAQDASPPAAGAPR
jgi:PAS domain S-box-containing protein